MRLPFKVTPVRVVDCVALPPDEKEMDVVLPVATLRLVTPTLDD
jgi:hypothetical protein